MPIFLAGDPGIGAPEVPAQASMTRPFVSEITILQRERNPDTPMVLWTVGGLVVLVCTLILIGGLTWGAGRINRREPTDTQDGAAAIGTGMTGDARHRRSSPITGCCSRYPAFVPAIVVAGVVIYVAMKDRRNRDGPHSEEPGSTDQDGSP